MFYQINLLNDIPEDGGLQAKSPNEGRKSKRRYTSLISLPKSLLADKIEFDGTGADVEKNAGKAIEKKVHNWRSLTDHLGVLTKTYTNRR